MDLREIAHTIAAQRYGGFAAHWSERADEIAAMVAPEDRSSVGSVLLALGICLSDAEEHGESPTNLIGMVGSALIEPTKVGQR